LPGQILCADPVKATTDVKQFRHDGPDGLDLNGDGHADLAIALSGLDEVGVILQDPKVPFSFSLASVAPVGTGCHQPSLLAMADLSNHGALDVVAGNTATNNLSVFLGNGAGAIAFSGSYSLTGPGNQVLTGLIIGDFNRDCRQDIVTSSYNGENFSIYLGQGDGTFADAVNYDSEVAALRAGGNITALAHDTDFEAVYCLDVNRTASPATNEELVTFVPRAQVELVLGQPLSPPYAILPAQQDPEAIAFGDLNRDGHLDIVVANRASNTLEVYINDGSGNFSQPFAPIATGLQPESVAIADVNNDGLNDVLVACNGSDAVFVHLNLGGGSLAGGTSVAVNAKGPHGIVALDMDGDSTVDFVTVNQYGNSVSVFVNPNGDGNFVAAPGFAPAGQPAGVFPVGNAPLGVAVADLNGDGKPDIVVANSNDDSVTVLLRKSGNTAVVVSSSTDFPLGGVIFPAPSQPAGTPPVTIPIVEPVSVAIADLNGDGFPDIVTADKFTGTVTILHGGKGGVGGNFFVPMDYVHYGNSTAIGVPPVKLSAGGPNGNPVVVLIADMNNDGVPDIVVGTFGTSSVIDFINQGSKTQGAATGGGDLNLKPASLDVVPFPGEVAFVFDAKLGAVLYKSGALVSFTASNQQPVTAMAAGGLIIPCVPNIGTTAPDNNVRLFQTK
jgi:hypothetical protein